MNRERSSDEHSRGDQPYLKSASILRQSSWHYLSFVLEIRRLRVQPPKIGFPNLFRKVSVVAEGSKLFLPRGSLMFLFLCLLIEEVLDFVGSCPTVTPGERFYL
jgi:hypothetical protein